MNQNLKFIMIKCTQFDPANRPNIDEVLNYSWFNTSVLNQPQKATSQDIKVEKNSQSSFTEVRG